MNISQNRKQRESMQGDFVADESDARLTARLINLIMERVHPWSAVKLVSISTKNQCWVAFETGFVTYQAEVFFGVRQAKVRVRCIQGGPHYDSDVLAERMSRIINGGFVRDDAGNLVEVTP